MELLIALFGISLLLINCYIVLFGHTRIVTLKRVNKNIWVGTVTIRCRKKGNRYFIYTSSFKAATLFSAVLNIFSLARTCRKYLRENNNNNAGWQTTLQDS